MENQTKHVQVPDAFFAKAKSEYQDWRWAWVRETAQNALDAGSTEIRYQVVKCAGTSEIMVSITDNGCGMDQSTIENVFLCLGASYKTRADSVGGFGYAKSLIALAHSHYVLQSQDNLVEGAGGSYRIYKSTPIQGVKITAYMDNSEYESICNEIVRFVSKLFLTDRTVRFFLNDAELHTAESPALGFPFSMETELGYLRFADSPETSQVLVSVRGLPMFVHYIYGHRGVSGRLELEGSFSRLTTNRDQLNSESTLALQRICKTLTLKKDILKSGVPVTVGMNFSAFSKRHPHLHSGQAASLSGLSSDEDGLTAFSVNAEFPKNFCVKAFNMVGLQSKGGDPDVATTSVTKALALFKSKWVRNMAFSWKFCVYAVLQTSIMFEARGIELRSSLDDSLILDRSISVEDVEGDFYFYDSVRDVRISTGFVLGDNFEGLHIQNGSGLSDVLILVNPTKFGPKINISDLLDVAIHECAHFFTTEHDETFIRQDMAIRRSLRRSISSTVLRENIKSFVSVW